MSELLRVEDAESSDTDGRIRCPDCAKSFAPLKNGTLRAHNCTAITGVTSIKSPRTPKGSKKAPPRVRNLSVAALGAGTEWAATGIAARGAGCDPADVPVEITNLPDADAMIGPIIDELWPSLPVGVQKTLIVLADKEDLIAAMFAWVEYGQQLRRWAESERIRREETVNVEIPGPVTGLHNPAGIPYLVSLTEPTV